MRKHIQKGRYTFFDTWFKYDMADTNMKYTHKNIVEKNIIYEDKKYF